jgi:hypothetical protein
LWGKLAEGTRVGAAGASMVRQVCAGGLQGLYVQLVGAPW